MYSQGSRPAPPSSEADHPSTFRVPNILDCSPPSWHLAWTRHVCSLTCHQQAVPQIILVKVYHSFPWLSFEYVNHCNFEPFFYDCPHIPVPKSGFDASFHHKVVSCLHSNPIDGSQTTDIFLFCCILAPVFILWAPCGFLFSYHSPQKTPPTRALMMHRRHHPHPPRIRSLTTSAASSRSHGIPPPRRRRRPESFQAAASLRPRGPEVFGLICTAKVNEKAKKRGKTLSCWEI